VDEHIESIANIAGTLLGKLLSLPGEICDRRDVFN
jgi:hypothetical protein